MRQGLKLEVVESPSGTPPIVMGDRGKIRQIINNVVGNAGASLLLLPQLLSCSFVGSLAVKHTKTGGILIEWGELVDANVEDALDSRKDSIRIGISM